MDGVLIVSPVSHVLYFPQTVLSHDTPRPAHRLKQHVTFLQRTVSVWDTKTSGPEDKRRLLWGTKSKHSCRSNRVLSSLTALVMEDKTLVKHLLWAWLVCSRAVYDTDAAWASCVWTENMFTVMWITVSGPKKLIVRKCQQSNEVLSVHFESRTNHLVLRPTFCYTLL